MASIASSVKKAIDDWLLGEADFAMLHACNAVDGTAKKAFPNLGSNARFTKLIRDSYQIFGPMAAPGIDLDNTRWPVKLSNPKAPGGHPDIADVIYGIHRCSHGHGEDLPYGFELLSDAAGPHRCTRLSIQKGKVQLSDRAIFGLIGVVVFNPLNIGQRVPDGYHLTFAGQPLIINDWWGKTSDFVNLAKSESLPSVKLDFTDWME